MKLFVLTYPQPSPVVQVEIPRRILAWSIVRSKATLSTSVAQVATNLEREEAEKTMKMPAVTLLSKCQARATLPSRLSKDERMLIFL